ncbi:N-formylglutamate amidohydrolase [Maricaulis sp.]|uniref:N-formylglutamate amidohydrolase n=1 Tax=Maricaulis sp. TaxID=1486257 RepID=UPI00260403BF|nr:N-formylglutamate amidohydrolase [Maricaulis sp.]
MILAPISSPKDDASANPAEGDGGAFGGLAGDPAGSIEGIVAVAAADREQQIPVIMASPHSGRAYEGELRRSTLLSVDQLRRSEDAYVDKLIEGAHKHGITTVCALFPRVFVDVNRSPRELDPGMYSDRLPASTDSGSRRTASGLGVIPRIAADGRPLYRRRFKVAEAEARLERYYRPFHAVLKAQIEQVRQRFGCAFLIDVHSMPDQSARGVDMVIGDRFGSSCHPGFADLVEQRLRRQGFVTVRNTPYAGGFTTEHYGRPETGVHAIQIEISRRLYLDEHRVALAENFASLKSEIGNFVSYLSEFRWSGQFTS